MCVGGGGGGGRCLFMWVVGFFFINSFLFFLSFLTYTVKMRITNCSMNSYVYGPISSTTRERERPLQRQGSTRDAHDCLRTTSLT